MKIWFNNLSRKWQTVVLTVSWLMFIGLSYAVIYAPPKIEFIISFIYIVVIVSAIRFSILYKKNKPKTKKDEIKQNTIKKHGKFFTTSKILAILMYICLFLFIIGWAVENFWLIFIPLIFSVIYNIYVIIYGFYDKVQKKYNTTFEKILNNIMRFYSLVVNIELILFMFIPEIIFDVMFYTIFIFVFLVAMEQIEEHGEISPDLVTIHGFTVVAAIISMLVLPLFEALNFYTIKKRAQEEEHLRLYPEDFEFYDENGNPVESKEIIKELDKQDKELGIKNENKKEQE